MGAYAARLLTGYRSDRELTVVWDPGNGAAGEVVQAVVRDLPGRHILLNETIDGTFPAHHPDPTVEANLEQLKAAVAEHGADIGVAFDGDGDRIGAIDGQGRVIWGDQILAILAADLLPRYPGAPILADVKASQMLFDEIDRLGGKAVMAPTGHSIIKTRMAELDAPLAGEMSGHIFFADGYYGFDDGVYAAIRLINAIAASGKSAAACATHCPRSSIRRKSGSTCPRNGSSPSSTRPATGSPGCRASPSTISTACGLPMRMAGGCCAPPTHKTHWWFAARPQTKTRWRV